MLRTRCASGRWRSPTAGRSPTRTWPRVAPRRERRRPRVFALAGVAAAIAAIAIVPTVVLTTRGGDVGRSIELAAGPSAPKGGGSAHVVAHRDGSATIELKVWKLPAKGQVYAAWLGKTGDRSPLGQFRIGDDGKATVTYTVPRGGLAGYRWLWVTSGPAVTGEQPSQKKTALWGP